MNRMRNRLQALAVAFTLFHASSAGATIIFDGNEWADLSLAQGMSINQVVASSLLSTDGYRYAMKAEVEALYASLGLTVGVTAASNNTGANFLIDNLGCLAACGGTLPFYFARFRESLTPNDYGTAWVKANNVANNGAITLGSAASMTQENSSIGHYLIRAAETSSVETSRSVPEPAGLALFGFALVGLGLVRRSRTVS